ncbi:MAG: sulfatase-like hydrolase/transferase [Deferribacteres bacterium]|nr:sulfatase-like hydrolase/transferase [Deferribacteres bacterium]
MPYNTRFRYFAKLFFPTLVTFAVFAGLTHCESTKNERLPNIVLIFIDDQGYADLGCFGAQGFATPNIDKMASEGMRFTNFYVSQAVCSASRAALMTGCYSERVGVRGAYMPWATVGLNPQEETIAEILKKKGYTTGIFGKWHLGHLNEFLPLHQGFDEYLGLPYSNDMWPVNFDGTPATEGNKVKYPSLPLFEGDKEIAKINTLEDQSTLTTRYTERAVKFIENNKNRPFFLYVPHSMVHVPLGVSEKFKGKSEQGMYGDTMMEIDWSVGEILKTLHKNELDDNTLVIYTSDNGPWLNFGNHAGSAVPLREGKGTMWEGGPRVPCVIRWPGHVPAGMKNERIASTIDILPTLAAITGAPLPQRKIDGVNILPLLQGDPEANPRDHFFFYYDGELRAVRQGKWKLHFPHSYRSYENVEPGRDGFPGPYGKGETGLALYNLDTDIGERMNVIEQEPEIAQRLSELAEKIRYELGDRLTGIQGKEVREPGRHHVETIQKIEHRAVGKKILLGQEYGASYTGGGKNAVIDGLRGTTDFQDGTWQGYEGTDFGALVDLGKVQKLRHISVGFLQNQMSWIFLPSDVQIEISLDGQNFDVIHHVSTEMQKDPKVKIQNNSIQLKAKPARYIRIYAKNAGVCPAWHSGAGGKTWIFVDEIVVE